MSAYYKKYKNYSLKILNDAFIDACRDGDIKLVKYLLTSPELKIHADIHADKEHGLQTACFAGYFNVVQYLLTSPELKEKADLHSGKDTPFIYAADMERMEIIQFFIFDLNIKKTESIHKYLKLTMNISQETIEEIEKMFTIRDLSYNLQNELNSDKTTSKKLKL